MSKQSTLLRDGAAFAILLLASLPGHAASVQLPAILDPSVIQQQSEQQRERIQKELAPRKETPLSPLDTKALEKPAAGSVPAIHFMLKRVEFSPSEILTKAELAAIAATYEGKEVSFSDLQALVAKINALYRSKGAIAAEAVIPPQDVSDGVVKIRLIEGHIGKYHLEGNASTKASYVTDRMHEKPGTLVNTNTLEQDLIRFNRTNDAQLSAELRPGQAVATTDVFLKLNEPQKQSLRVFADHAGSASTGEFRYGAIYENRSLFGLRDDLNLSYTGAEGYQGASLNYAYPLGTWGDKLLLGVSNDHTKIVSGSFAPLDITGDSTLVTGTLRHPILLDARQALFASVGLISRQSKTYIGSDLLQDETATDATVSADFSRRDHSGEWSGNVTVLTGTDKTTDTLHYTLWRGNLHRDQILPKGFNAKLNLAWQAGDSNPLPSGEQYFIGGSGSVRGYSTAQYGGNRGYVTNIELHHALGVWSDYAQIANHFSGFVFLDHGQVDPGGPGQQAILLTSAGFGGEVNHGNKVFTRVTLGCQLHRRPEEPKSCRADFTFVAETL
jgi:hemolysin activation/secretion protein